VVLPIIDYLNHSFTPNCRAEPFYDDEERNSYILIISERDIDENEQLLINYGNFSNSFFLSKYGFCVENNENKEFSIIIFEEIIDSLNNNQTFKLNFSNPSPDNNEFNEIFQIDLELKSQIMKRNSINFQEIPDLTLKLFNNKFENNFLKIIRILCLNKEDLTNKDKCFNHNFSHIFSLENEKLALRFLMNTLNYYHKKTNNKNYNEIISSIKQIDNKDQYDYLNLCILENEEKVLLEKNIDFLQKKEQKLFI